MKGGKYGNSRGYGKGKAPVKNRKESRGKFILEKEPKEERVLKRKEFLRGKNSKEKRVLKRTMAWVNGRRRLKP